MTPVLPLIVLALAAIALAAVLSAGEEAGRSITRAAAHDAHADGARGAVTIMTIANDSAGPVRITAFLRLAAEMTSAVCATLIFVTILAPWWLVLIVTVAVCAVADLLVVGLSPRTFGRHRPVLVLGWIGVIMVGADAVSAPIVGLLRHLRPGSQPSSPQQTGDELRDMVDRVSESEHIEDDEREMLHSVFELSRTMVREVMVPRTDMVTIQPDVPITKAMNLFTRSGYSRIPVTGESLDDVRGVLYLKDLLRHVTHRPEQVEEKVMRLMRDPVFVPETKVVDDVLAQMRSTGVHIAVAFDEYGGVAGLVTIEDILEELVGDLTDEHDRSEPTIEPMENGFRVPARLSVDELGELFDREIDEPEIDSTGGLVAKALGRVPILGSVTYAYGLRLEVVEAQGRRRRASTVAVTRVDDEQEEGEHD